MTALCVATWNQDGWKKPPYAARAQRLRDLKVDVLCAQELTRSRFDAFLGALNVNGADGWWGVHSLTAQKDLPPPSRYWGVAAFGRTAACTPDRDNASVVGMAGGTAEEPGLFWRRTVSVPVDLQGGVGALRWHPSTFGLVPWSSSRRWNSLGTSVAGLPRNVLTR